MNRDQRIDGKTFVMRAVRVNTMLSLPALVIVLGCAAALLDLPGELWKGLWIGIAVYTVLGSPVNFVLQRRTMSPIATWLDTAAPDAAAAPASVASLAKWARISATWASSSSPADTTWRRILPIWV